METACKSEQYSDLYKVYVNILRRTTGKCRSLSKLQTTN